jgi:manganese transport protein
MLTGSKSKMGPLVAPMWLSIVAGIIAAIIIALNVKLLIDFTLG